MNRYPRDMVGYGATPPDAGWPGGAQIAVQFVINYEEGGENAIIHGDTASEAFLSEIVGAEAWPDRRHANIESIYEFGARVGFWRLHRLFQAFEIPVTVYGVATALARSPEAVEAMLAADWEIASHGLKWIDYKEFSKDDERDHMVTAIQLHQEVVGAPPLGWYTGRSSEHTLDLAAELGCFDYLADSYADELPYWRVFDGRPQLIVPYSLDANDMRFATPQGFNAGDQFFNYLKDTFDGLYAEGEAGNPKMMSIGLHCRLAGRPGRAQAVRRFIEYVYLKPNVWFARRIDIARHWRDRHPYQAPALQPSTMSRADFIGTFCNIFGQAAWIAERAFDDELGAAHDTPIGLLNALARKFRVANESERRGVLESQREPSEWFSAARTGVVATRIEQYQDRFGYPFIIADERLEPSDMEAALERRIKNEPATEFDEACRQVERIGRGRLLALFS